MVKKIEVIKQYNEDTNFMEVQCFFDSLTSALEYIHENLKKEGVIRVTKDGMLKGHWLDPKMGGVSFTVRERKMTDQEFCDIMNQ